MAYIDAKVHDQLVKNLLIPATGNSIKFQSVIDHYKMAGYKFSECSYSYGKSIKSAFRRVYTRDYVELDGYILGLDLKPYIFVNCQYLIEDFNIQGVVNNLVYKYVVKNAEAECSYFEFFQIFKRYAPGLAFLDFEDFINLFKKSIKFIYGVNLSNNINFVKGFDTPVSLAKVL